MNITSKMSSLFKPSVAVVLTALFLQPFAAAVDESSANRVPQKWVEKRLEESQKRLEGSPAGQLVAKSIAAHGGLKRWHEAGDLTFRFIYTPQKGLVRDTLQTIDTWSSRARHRTLTQPEIEFGWDGKQAWHSKGAEEFAKKINPRFWALTPYYFVAIPFVLADSGVKLTLVEDGTFEGQNYRRVKVTFGDGVGDAPDDYYVVYIHPKTHQVGGVRYIVSYKGFFKDGGHSPEKFMAYENQSSTDSIVFPQSFRTFSVNKETGQITKEVITTARMTDVKFEGRKQAQYFSVPQHATLQEGL